MAVYLVQAETGGPIKVGTCRDGSERRRLSELQCGHPEKLVVRALLPGGVAEEKEMHQEFARHRIHGEWFAPCLGLIRLGAKGDALVEAYEQGRQEGASSVQADVDALVSKRTAELESQLRRAWVSNQQYGKMLRHNARVHEQQMERLVRDIPIDLAQWKHKDAARQLSLLVDQELQAA